LDALPDVTAVAATVTEAPESVVTGVSVTDVTLFTTLTVYAVVPALCKPSVSGAKVGTRDPKLVARWLKVGS
jgi:hypothetical protein